jgi:hypothetical protein
MGDQRASVPQISKIKINKKIKELRMYIVMGTCSCATN